MVLAAGRQATKRVALGVRAPDVRRDRAEREREFGEVLRQRLKVTLLPGRAGGEER